MHGTWGMCEMGLIEYMRYNWFFEGPILGRAAFAIHILFLLLFLTTYVSIW